MHASVPKAVVERVQCIYRVVPPQKKKTSHYHIEKSYKIVLKPGKLKHIKTIDLLVKLKYELSTIIVFVDIRYSMRDLLFDL